MFSEYTLATAQKAGQENKLREWCIEYLKGPGGNIHLAQTLEEQGENIQFSGPTEMDLKPMRRLAGSASEGLTWIDTKWEENIRNMMKSIQEGWTPPPLMLTDYWDPAFHLTDGSHRHEALTRLGRDKYWTIVLKCTDHAPL